MTTTVQKLLNTFDNLTYSERLDLLSEILRRTVYLDFEPLSDEELTLNAEDIFLTLDDGHGCSDATFFSDIATEYLSTIYTSELVLLRGVTRRTGARGISIRATGIWDLRAAYEKWNAQRSTLAI